MADEQRSSLGPAGAALAQNIRRIREGQRLTYVELSERLAGAGRPVPVLGLRRIERGERRVDVDDLLALANALGVTPVDLLVPSTAADDEPYNVTPNVPTTAATARDWISGQGFLKAPESPAELAEAIRWMPKARAQVAAREWLPPMQREWLRQGGEAEQQEGGTDG